MRRLGIIGELALSSACILLALGVALSLYSLSQLREIIYEQSFRRVEAQALNWIEANTVQINVTLDGKVLQRLVHELADHGGSAYVVLVDNSGRVMASARVPAGLTRARQNEIAVTPKAKVFETSDSRGIRYFEVNTSVQTAGMSQDLDTMFALTAPEQNAAILRVGIARLTLENELNTLLLRNTRLFFGLVLLALFIEVTMVRRFVRPIVSIGASARAIAGGDLLSRVRDGADLRNEVGELVRNFNDMAQRMSELHSGLEEKVRERTRDLEIANTKLQELDRVKSEFLSTVSHEFRTPLTSIKAFARILLESPIDDEHTQRRFLTIIDTESDRLSRLISDMLDLAKIESGAIVWRADRLDARDVLQDACAAMASLAKEREISVEIAEAPVSLVVGDKDRLQQVVTNLVGNALKFCPTGASVKVSIRRAAMGGPRGGTIGDFIVMSVSDNGPGIPAQDVNRLFERFYRGTTTGYGIKGTGLGLAICRQIVTHHGGEIWVESQLGRGSTFNFTVPAARQAFQAGPDQLGVSRVS
jgi:signal transduction histidine kinase